MTPNDSHYALCCAALEHGLDIVCDKPLATNLEDALDLVKRVRGLRPRLLPDLQLHGFPLLRQARAMVRDGDLGEIRMVQVEYVQGHNAGLIARRARRRGGELALRAGAGRSVADPRRHRQPCPSYGALRDRAALRPHLADVRAVVPGRNAARPCRHPLPARERRARRDVGDAGWRRRRPWPRTSASSATRAASNGSRRSRTSSSTPAPARRRPSSNGAARASSPKRYAPARRHRPSRGLPGSLRRPLRRCGGGDRARRRGERPTAGGRFSRPSRTAPHDEVHRGGTRIRRGPAVGWIAAESGGLTTQGREGGPPGRPAGDTQPSCRRAPRVR